MTSIWVFSIYLIFKGNGQVEKLFLQPNEAPLTLACEFCKKHNLPNEVASVLVKEIESHISKNSQISHTHDYKIQDSHKISNQLGAFCSQSERADSSSNDPQKETNSLKDLCQPGEESAKERERRLKWENRNFTHRKPANSKLQQGIKTQPKQKNTSACPLSPPIESLERDYELGKENSEKASEIEVREDLEEVKESGIFERDDNNDKNLLSDDNPISEKAKPSKNEQKTIENGPRVWDRLFILSKEKAKARAEFVELYKKQKEEQEAAMYTYKPEINENSKKMAEGSKTERVEERYKTFRKTIEMKSAKEKQLQRIKEIQECPFVPNLSKHPYQKIDSKKVTEKFTNLYEEAKERDTKREELVKKMYFCILVKN